MNILKDFKVFAKERGYEDYKAALSHIAFLRTFDDRELAPTASREPHNSVFYWKWLCRLPCIGCSQAIGVSARAFNEEGDLVTELKGVKNTYHCIPICNACTKHPEKMFAIKIRFDGIVLSLLTTYLRCVEGT